MIKKGVSKRRLQQELMSKGVAAEIISNALDDVQRDEIEDIAKIIKRKINRYDDDKLKSYLMRQGFKYGDILLAISNYESAGSD
jgi:SOS response regulatory protein OraA/RecX